MRISKCLVIVVSNSKALTRFRYLSDVHSTQYNQYTISHSWLVLFPSLRLPASASRSCSTRLVTTTSPSVRLVVTVTTLLSCFLYLNHAPCSIGYGLLLHVERLHAVFFFGLTLRRCRPYFSFFSPHSSTFYNTSSNPSRYPHVCSTAPDDPADSSRPLNALAQWVQVARRSKHGRGAHLVG